MAHIIRQYIPEEPATFTDWVDDDGLGNGPFKMVLTIWREGDVCHADWTGTDDQAPGSINFHIHEGLCKLFLGIYMIMAFDPEILFNDGLYDVFEVTLPEGSLLNPTVPGTALEQAERAHPPVRLHQRRAGPEGPRALDGRRVRNEPVLRLLRLRRGGRVLPVRRAPLRRAAGPLQGRRARRALLVAAVPDDAGRVRGELLPRADQGVHAGARHRWRRASTAAARASRRSTSSPAPGRSPSTTTARRSLRGGSTAAATAAAAASCFVRASGEQVELPSKIDQVPVGPGDRLVFRTAGAGGWGDPLDRDPQSVLRDVLRDLVSPEAALREYGVVIDGDTRRRGRDDRGTRATAVERAAPSSHSISATPQEVVASMTTSLRSRLAQPDALVALGAHDGLTARLAERAGIEAIYHGGYALAAHHFGLPDVGLVGRAEVVESVRRMRAATELPIIVDADTGYGSEAGVWLTTRELEAAGANAVQIEDQVSPKRCGHMEGKEVIPAAEMALKVRAAVAARRSDETLIIARTDALQVTGLDDAIDRCNAYAEAGADLVFVDAPRTREEYAAIAERCTAPGVANMSETGTIAGDPDLRARGDGLRPRHLPQHADVALREGLHRALRGRRPRPDDRVARGSLHELRRRQRPPRPRRVAVTMSTKDVYATRGFGGRQGAGERPAVVVVDFIEGFTNPESRLACDADSAVVATRALLDAARAVLGAGDLHDGLVHGRRSRPGGDVHRQGAGARDAPPRLSLGRGRPAPRPPRRTSS